MILYTQGWETLGKVPLALKGLCDNIEFMFDWMGPCIGDYMGRLIAYILEWCVPALAHSRLYVLLAILDEFYVGIVCNNCFVHNREVFKTI